MSDAADPRAIARAAFARAAELEADILSRWPHAWRDLDYMRTHPPEPWPEWCLLPMAAAASLVAENPQKGVDDVATMAALYAWRRCRSTYVLHPELTNRLLTQTPDAVTVDDVTLPEWCVYIYAGGAALWMHLEFDVNHHRPELRLLLDTPGAPLLGIPIYLNGRSTTEAIGEWHGNTLSELGRRGILSPAHAGRGGDQDALAAEFADRLDAYVGIAAYLSRPEADIGELGRPGVRPVRRRTMPDGKTVWMVGYTNQN